MKVLSCVLLAIGLLGCCGVGYAQKPNYADGTWDCDKVANLTFQAANAEADPLAGMGLRSTYSNDPRATAIILDAFNSGWRGLTPTELAQANYQECKAASARSQPVNAQSDPNLQGAELRWQLLHGLGKMIPPFLLGVVLIGGLWLATVLWRKGRRRREDN